VRHRAALIKRLLQDPRVQASINVQIPGDFGSDTALHLACKAVNKPEMPAIIQILLEAGADLQFANEDGDTPLSVLQRSHPTHPTTLTLVEQSLDAKEASFLVKARCLVMAASPPSSLQGRVACGLPLPRVALAPMTNDLDDEEDEEKSRCELRTMVAWLMGVECGGMPRDVFRVVLDLLMPFWDPLRRKAQGPPHT